MFLQGEIERAEAVSRPMIRNALASFRDQGYLVDGARTRSGRKIALAKTFRSEEGARAIEARVCAYLAPSDDGGR